MVYVYPNPYPHPHPRPLPASRDPRHLDILEPTYEDTLKKRKKKKPFALLSLCKNAKLHATMFCFWSRNVSICCFNCYKFDITCRLELLLYLATKLKTRYFICDTTLRNTKQPTVHSTVTFRRDLSSGKGIESAR